MKLLPCLLVLFLFTMPKTASAQNFKTAVDYLNFVSEEQEVISKNMWKYTKAIAHSKSDKNVTNKRKVLIKSIERAILKIERAKGFDGDRYKNQVLDYLNFNRDLLNEDYAKILDMKAVAEQSYDAMEAYMLMRKLADEKMAESQANYEMNFHLFAAKNNIEIIKNESDLGKKMKLSNIVFEHYNELYLVFFKVYVNELYLWEAMERKDVSAIQQNTNALNKAAIEGLKVLDTTNVYKNDTSIVEATRTIFEYYIDESENQIPELVDFYILNESMTAITETLEKTPERKRTKKQIDAYNKKVKEVNKAVKTYNSINDKLNVRRQKTLNGLNMANDTFLSKHIPKD